MDLKSIPEQIVITQLEWRVPTIILIEIQRSVNFCSTRTEKLVNGKKHSTNQNKRTT